MKRVTAIILAIIILFTSFTPVVATENSTVHTENKKVQWLVENNFLVGRGKDGDLKLGSTITRAEFTRMALVAKGEEDAAKEYPNVSTKFKDVDENHWAEKYISYASDKGYISGYPDGNFKPEGEITYEEIISILARIHPNYTKIETKSKGWAEGFIKFSSENGILEGLKIEGSYKSFAIREKTFEMIYNFKNIENDHSKGTKSTKPIETKNEAYFGWNGFYPYWFQFGYRPRIEKPVEPEVKPEPETPDVKPEPEEPKEPETPEKPKEFDKENIAKVEVISQPSNVTYTEGESLDLTGLVVTLTDNQGLTEKIGLEKFGEYRITTSPANGTPLTVTDHNGKTVVISKGEVKAETEALKVNPKVFDKENIAKIKVLTPPTKLNYTEGEKLDLTGLRVELTDNQGLNEEIGLDKFEEYGITTSPANGTPLTVTDHNGKTVIISKDEATVETEALTVKEKVFDKENITKIEVKTQPKKLVYTEGDKLDLTGLEVTLIDNQDLTKDVKLENFEENGLTALPANGTPLTMENNGKTVKISKGEAKAETNALTVNEKVFDPEHVETITVKIQPKLTYTEGEQLDLTGLEVTLKDNQGLTKDVTFEQFDDFNITASPVNETTLTSDHNGKTVVISKGEAKTETEALKVNPKVFDKENIAKIKVLTLPKKINYTEGEKLDLTGLRVELTDNQGLNEEIGLDKFEDYGITTSPANGTELKLANNGNPVVISKGEVKAETEALTVKEKVFNPEHIEKITVKNQPTKIVYTDGEKLDLTGLVVTLTDNQGLTKDVEFKDFEEYGLKASPENGTPLTVTDHNRNPVEINKGELKAETNALTVNPKVFDPTKITKIEVKTQPSNVNYTEDETLDLTGLVVTLTDNQGLTEKIGLEKFGEYRITTSPANGTPLTVTDHNGKTVVISKGEAKVETNALTVNPKVFDKEKITGIEVLTPPTKLEYTEGEKLDLTGLVVTLTDNQGLPKDVELKDFEEYGLTASPANGTPLTVTDHNGKTVVISKGEAKVETNALTVKEKEFNPGNVETITVKTQPLKLNYTEGETLDLTGLKVTLTDNQDLTKDVKFENFEENGLTASPANGTPLTMENNGKTVKISKGEAKAETNALTVNEKVFDPENVETITVKIQPKLTYTEGEQLDLTGLEVTLKDNQGLTKDVTFEQFDDFNITASPANETPLTVTDHNGKTVVISKGEVAAETDKLTVNPKVFDKENIDKIKVLTLPKKLNYTEGEKLDLTGLRVELTDNQGLNEEIGLDKFEDYGITTSPTNGTPLTVDHNGKSVEITKGKVKVETNALTVKEKVFDKDNITKIEVISKPNLTYKVNDILDLRGLNVKITDDQGLEKEVELANFQDYGITTDPANKTQLKIQHDKTTIKVSNDQVEVPSESNPLKLRIVSYDQFNGERTSKIEIKNSLIEVYKNLGDIKLGIDNFENKYYIVIPKDVNSAKFNKEGLKASILNVIKKKEIKSYNILGTQRYLYEGESAKPDDEILKILREDILKIAGLEENPESTDEEILKNLKEKLPETKLRFTSENIELDFEIVILNPIDEEKLEKIEEDFIAHMKDTSVEVKNSKKGEKGFTVSYENKIYNVTINLEKTEKISQFFNYGYVKLLSNFLTGEKVGPYSSMKNLKSIIINTRSKTNNTDEDKMNVDNWGTMDRLELEKLLPNNYSVTSDMRNFNTTFPCNSGDIEFKGTAKDLTGYDTIIEYFYVDQSTNTGGIITRIINFSF